MNVRAEHSGSVFVVIDPKRMLQPALIKGEWIATRDNSQLVVYCCIYDATLDQNEDAQQRELDLTRTWIERLAAPAEAYGLDVTVTVEWDNLWREAIVAAATGAHADLVIKTASRHTALGRRVLKTADWSLLAECVSPILLVRDGHLWENGTLLAAVKLKPEDSDHDRLNKRIVEASHDLAENAGFELHAATAFKGDDIYFDRQQFADSCGLPRNRVHGAAGSPQKAISSVAAEIGADIIVVGNAGHSMNETAQRLVDEVDADILVLPSPEASKAA